MKVICLMGPTASGKTDQAVKLIKRLPLHIISVDSAMVYRGMDIGTAKPDAALLSTAPHSLIDICDPREAYSAGRFMQDVEREIVNAYQQQKYPMLVGGTMLYFNVLQKGLAALPSGSKELRETLQQRLLDEGRETLHAELQACDPEAAFRIKVQDTQRLLRALEVYHTSGRPMTSFLKNTETSSKYQFLNLSLMPEDRRVLHERIEQRFKTMMAQGFIQEVERLYRRGDLSPTLPAIRAVGYRECWDYLAGNITLVEMQARAVISTRQLAKRQLTWLRSFQDAHAFCFQKKHVVDELEALINKFIVMESSKTG